MDGKNLPPDPAEVQQKFTTTGYNCHNPISIRYIDNEQRCDPITKEFQDDKEVTWDILVHPLKQSFNGYSCSIVESQLTICCGVWSYNQILGVPGIEVRVHVPFSECQYLVQGNVYRSPDGIEIPLNQDK